MMPTILIRFWLANKIVTVAHFVAALVGGPSWGEPAPTPKPEDAV
jgi:hypothetical protein